MRFLGFQCPFLIGDHEGTIGIEADAIGRAETTGEDFGRLAILRDFDERAVMRHDGLQRMPRTFGVVEIALRVRLQAHREFMKVLGDLMIAVEAFVEVGFLVAIEIAQHHELIAARQVNRVIDPLEAERLKQARGDAFPLQRRGFLALLRGIIEPFKARDNPDVAIPSTSGQAIAAGKKIEPRESQLAEPRIGDGIGEHVRHERFVLIADRGLGFEDLGPTFWAARHQDVEVEGQKLQAFAPIGIAKFFRRIRKREFSGRSPFSISSR